MTKIAGSGSFSQRHGSADPDPHQNVMDPETLLCTVNFQSILHASFVNENLSSVRGKNGWLLSVCCGLGEGGEDATYFIHKILLLKHIVGKGVILLFRNSVIQIPHLALNMAKI
jgi:hypothetical protein